MSGVIGENWSASPTAPAPIRPTTWLTLVPTILLLPLRPARLGPRVALATWEVTLAAWLVALIVGGALVSLGIVMIGDRELFLLGRLDRYSLIDLIRLPFATLVFTLWMGTQQLGDIYAIPIGLVLWLAIAVGIAMLIAPLIAAGERRRRLLGRSVRLVLWSHAGLVWFGVLLIGLGSLLRGSVEPDWTVQYLEYFAEWIFGGVGLLLWLWLRLILRMGGTYSGPSEGPGFEPVRAACETCGYALTGLTEAARCPECGRLVAESLPARRGPGPWLASGHRWVGWWRSLYQVLVRPDFFERIAVRGSLRPAVRFALRTISVLALVLALAAGADIARGLAAGGAVRWHSLLAWMLLAFALASLGLLLGLMVSALRSCRFGWLDERPTSTVLCYASALPLPAFIALALVRCAANGFHRAGWFSTVRSWPGLGSVGDLVWVEIGLSLLPLAAFAWGVWRVWRGLRAVRFASA